MHMLLPSVLAMKWSVKGNRQNLQSSFCAKMYSKVQPKLIWPQLSMVEVGMFLFFYLSLFMTTFPLCIFWTMFPRYGGLLCGRHGQRLVANNKPTNDSQNEDTHLNSEASYLSWNEIKCIFAQKEVCGFYPPSIMGKDRLIASMQTRKDYSDQ